MYNFEYYTPTFIEFGKKSEEKVAQLIKAQNGKKVLIHYGGHSAKKSGNPFVVGLDSLISVILYVIF